MAIKYKVGDLTTIMNPSSPSDKGRMVRIITVGEDAEMTVRVEEIDGRGYLPAWWSPTRLGPVLRRTGTVDEYGEVCP